MSVLAAFGWCCISYWVGVWVTKRSEPKTTPAERSWQRFGDLTRAAMVRLRSNRKFVGAGPQIYQSGIWTLEGFGQFRVTIEEVEGETIEGSAA